MNRFEAGRLTGSLAGYVTLLTDFIRREPATLDGEDTRDGLPVVRNANGGRARIHGVEGEIVHHLIRVLASGGEGAAGELVAKLGAKAEVARDLAYRLYTLCERKKRAAEALAYNGLVQS